MDYMMLCQFLQNYKNKLLLSKKQHDFVDENILTNDQLRQAKKDFNDHLQLDFNQLLAETEKKERREAFKKDN